MMLSVCFIIMLIWLVSFTVMAFGVDEPMMDRAYYRKGMDYQKRLDSLRRGADRGWYLETNIRDGRLPAGSERILVYLRNRNRSVSAAKRAVLSVVLERPASTRGRLRRRLTRSRPGTNGGRVFAVNPRVPAGGYWELILEAELDGDARVYHRKRFYVGR